VKLTIVGRPSAFPTILYIVDNQFQELKSLDAPRKVVDNRSRMNGNHENYSNMMTRALINIHIFPMARR
jgi:hypothetical protein